MREPLRAAFLTSGDGQLVLQLLADTGMDAVVALVIRDRPQAIDDPTVPTGIRTGPTHARMAELKIDLVGCYIKGRGTRLEREQRQEQNILYALGEHQIDFLCLVDCIHPLLPRGELLRRFSGRLLHITSTALSLVTMAEDGTATVIPHCAVAATDTLASLLAHFRAEHPPAPPKAEWPAVAAQLGFASEEEMWRQLYLTEGQSLLELQKKFHVGTETLRVRLAQSGIALRRSGRPAQELLSDEELDLVLSKGIGVTARERGISYFTLYDKVQRTRRAKRERLQ